MGFDMNGKTGESPRFFQERVSAGIKGIAGFHFPQGVARLEAHAQTENVGVKANVGKFDS